MVRGAASESRGRMNVGGLNGNIEAIFFGGSEVVPGGGESPPGVYGLAGCFRITCKSLNKRFLHKT